MCNSSFSPEDVLDFWFPDTRHQDEKVYIETGDFPHQRKAADMANDG